MDSTNNLTDAAILTELGNRIDRCRLHLHLTQADLAEQAGVSKRTVERLEAGASVQLSTFIRILRVLNLLQELEKLIPEVGVRPMDMLLLKGKERKRASTKRHQESSKKKWSWDDEA